MALRTYSPRALQSMSEAAEAGTNKTSWMSEEGSTHLLRTNYIADIMMRASKSWSQRAKAEISHRRLQCCFFVRAAYPYMKCFGSALNWQFLTPVSNSYANFGSDRSLATLYSSFRVLMPPPNTRMTKSFLAAPIDAGRRGDLEQASFAIRAIMTKERGVRKHAREELRLSALLVDHKP